MIVKLRRKNTQYPDLTPKQQYAVIGIEADDFRLLLELRGGPDRIIHHVASAGSIFSMLQYRRNPGGRAHRRLLVVETLDAVCKSPAPLLQQYF